jgi:antitoxin CptB
MDDTTWSRLRWRCRRGMLENDIILARWLERVGRAIPDGDVAALDRLLDLGDNELWDLLSGRTEVQDEALQHLVRQLREPEAREAAKPAG